MTLTGTSWLGGERASASGRTFVGVDPANGNALDPLFHVATAADVDVACARAAAAFEVYGRSAPSERAAFLRAVADELEKAREELVARAHAESGLPLPRLTGELGRTTGQLRLFADVAAEGSWVDARIDRADPERKPLPKPDVRSLRRPLGPVAVFGASNFPLAFSVAGGDTASALAAGNPVVVKAHPAHPGASELAGAAIAAAAASCGLPAGVFALLFDDGFAVGEALVRHPLIRAVGFTGSRGGGHALVKIASERPQPIPVYAEMGSVNPVLVLPGALAARGRAIADGLQASVTLGVGQFCTNPGLVFVPAGADGDAFAERMAELTRAAAGGVMLTPRIASVYASGVDRLRAQAELVAEGPAGEALSHGRPAVFRADGAAVLGSHGLTDEVFGPSTLLVRFRDRAELLALVESLEGQLTATVHGEASELPEYADAVRALEAKSGRLVFDQFPTGVEVGHAMVHGGPVPATSDGRSTSVGTRAIERFTRPIAFQNAPAQLLPPELQDANPLGIARMVDGVVTTKGL